MSVFPSYFVSVQHVPKSTTIPFALAVLTSAFLLFWSEPLFARLVLPMLGGSPAVWNTCLMYFQALLLGGYLYAHASSRYLRVRQQVILHIALLLICFVALPLGIPSGWAPPASSNVIPWLIAVLSVSVGAPFLVLSATAPLLQKWFASTAEPSKDPYVLYAASNAGSFLGLLAFPLILEPRMRLGQQSSLWTVVYGVAFTLVGLCAWIVWKRAQTVVSSKESSDEDATPPIWSTRLKWVALAFVPSSLLLGITTFLSTDIAATPLLWVIPLAIYLLTFVIVFGSGARHVGKPAVYMHAALISALALFLFWQTTLGFRRGYALHLAVFTVTVLVLHGRLAASRPSPRYLTSYYLWISLGGALGGAFTAIIVPLIFQSTRDYWMMLVLACFLRPSSRKLDEPHTIAIALVPAIVLGVLSKPDFISDSDTMLWAVSGLVGLALLFFSRNAIRFGVAIASIVIAGFLLQTTRGTIFTDRSFFGIYRVTRNYGPATMLFHGSTIHGAQVDTAKQLPVTYYHPNGPVGQVMKTLQLDIPDRSVGAVGLGTGSILCYSKPRENWTFFEIDPHVEAIARNPKLFTFMSTCPVKANVVIGDARLTMEREPDARYSMLVLDAFSSDAIPVHLLSREALATYRRIMTDRGILLVHISNRRLELEPVVGALARDARMFALIRNHEQSDKNDNFEYGSDWVVLSSNEAELAPLARDKRWRAVAAGDKVWTDDYSNLFRVIKW